MMIILALIFLVIGIEVICKIISALNLFKYVIIAILVYVIYKALVKKN